MKKTLPVTLAIITLNEEQNIARCIQSVPWASEVIIVDSGSTDKTLQIAEKLGAKVHSHPFQGFRKQKQMATDLATHEWVLSLDADEALSAQLSKEIFESYPWSADGYMMPRLSYHMGRWIRHGGWYPDLQLRLFNKQRAHWGGGHVHEKVECARKHKFKAPIHHWVFKDLTHQVAANNRYSGLGAKDLFERKKKFNLGKLLVKPVSKFFECYFVKRGFMDGLPGFIIAVGAAYSVFLKFSKLYELERGLNKSE